MKKNVWILSHNSTPPSYGQWIRHYMFSLYSDKQKYNTTIIASSYVHLSDTNFAEKKKGFTLRDFEGVRYLFVNLKNYSHSSKQRITNMLKYAFVSSQYSVKELNEVPDVIYASSPDPLTWISGYRLSKKHGAKFIVETRDLWPETFIEMGAFSRKSIVARILYRIESFIYSRADLLVFTFEGGKKYIEEKCLNVNTNNIYNINNGVDLDLFKNNQKDFVYENEYLDDVNTKCIVYTGSLGKANDIYELMHLGLKLKRFEKLDTKILIFGDGLERVLLEEFKAKHNLSNVLFMGRVDKKYIPSILTKSNLNIISGFQSDLYRFGYSFNKLFDYMAAGQPIVSTVKSDFDLLEKFGIGKTVDLSKDIELYNVVTSYLDLDDSGLEANRQNMLEVVKEYDYSALSRKFYEIIEK